MTRLSGFITVVVMRHVLNYLTWAALFFFLAPTVMAIASWSSLPGDPLYAVKLTLEDAAFTFLSPSEEARGAISVKRTERRFAEASRLLSDKASVKGLTYVDQQVVTTKEVISHAKDQKTQAALAQDYIVTLNTMAASLEAQKQTLVATSKTGPASVSKNTGTVVAKTAIANKPGIATPTPTTKGNTTASKSTTGNSNTYTTPTPTPGTTNTPQTGQTGDAEIDQVVQQIEQTQQTIEETILEMETVTAASAEPEVTPTPTATLTPTPTRIPPVDGSIHTAGAGMAPAAAASAVTETKSQDKQDQGEGKNSEKKQQSFMPTVSPVPTVTPVPTIPTTPQPTAPPPTETPAPTATPEQTPVP